MTLLAQHIFPPFTKMLKRILFHLSSQPREYEVTLGKGPDRLCRGCSGSAAAPRSEASTEHNWDTQQIPASKTWLNHVSRHYVNVGINFSLQICAFPLRSWLQALPAVHSSGCVCLLCPAAFVSPGPLLVVPGQTLTADHCEAVADPVTHVLVSGRFPKISIQQRQVTDPCS